MDFQILTLINQFGHGTLLDTVSQFISRHRSMIGIRTIILTIVIILKKKYWKFVLLSFVLAVGLFYLVAELGGKTILVEEIGIRPRPYVAHAEIQPIGIHSTDSSFPSSHVTATVALLTVLVILFPALWPYAVFYALLMAWSRMHNGMHYPSDVLAGAIIGIICGWLGVVLSRRVFRSE